LTKKTLKEEMVSPGKEEIQTVTAVPGKRKGTS